MDTPAHPPSRRPSQIAKHQRIGEMEMVKSVVPKERRPYPSSSAPFCDALQHITVPSSSPLSLSPHAPPAPVSLILAVVVPLFHTRNLVGDRRSPHEKRRQGEDRSTAKQGRGKKGMWERWA